jgi:phage-related protein
MSKLIGCFGMRIEAFTNDIKTFIQGLDAQMHVRTMRCLDLLKEHGHELRMPVSKSLSNGLFELRVGGNIQVRIIYCFHQETALLLHAFIKKTDKIPKKEMELALKRRKLLV